jgi:NADH-quinone oxidoreductase subunit I
MRVWFGNIYTAVVTVIRALWVTMRYWVITYDPRRRTFTEQYEFPELPLKVAPRYRGFHRFDLTTCIACEACARACPANCIYIGKQRVAGRKGFQVTSFTIDYGKCLFCALCIDPCPVDCIFMGWSHDLSCYSREGCQVDFSRLPVEIAWGRATLDPLAVANSKAVPRPVHGGPNA